ncbi:transmembrane protein, putative [Medicago truncatula]|uniref:Transmembrane protein, putative n=1 Tax=Medicago truncatula TaxID=3880 RepID=A0A072V1P3_MEDTR|nr:transmembrane protein, putative [Medicago truncatula]
MYILYTLFNLFFFLQISLLFVCFPLISFSFFLSIFVLQFLYSDFIPYQKYTHQCCVNFSYINTRFSRERYFALALKFWSIFNYRISRLLLQRCTNTNTTPIYVFTLKQQNARLV